MGLIPEVLNMLDGGSEDTNGRRKLGIGIGFISGACLSSKEEWVVFVCRQSTVSIQRDFGGFIMKRNDMLSSGGLAIRINRLLPRARKC